MAYIGGYKYSIKLNNEKLKGIIIGANTIEKLEESFDEAGFNIPLTVRDYEYEMFGVLEIKVKDFDNEEDKTFQFLIMEDKVTSSTKYGYFEHKVRCVEYTEKTNKYMIYSLLNTIPLNTRRKARFSLTDNTDPTWGTKIPFTRATSLNSTANYYSQSMSIRAKFPIINFSEVYYSDEETVFSQVPKIKVYNEDQTSYYETNVYLKLDDGNDEIISNGDVSFNMTKGNHTIHYGYGYRENDMSFTIVYVYHFLVIARGREKSTLLDVVERLRNIKPFETSKYHSSTRLFTLTPELENVLSKIESPQFFIQKATMFQVLSGIFKYINAIPRLIHSGFDFPDYLSYDDFNLIVGEFNKNKKVSYSSSQDIELYATRSLSLLERTLPNELDKPNMESPANNFFKTVRATDVEYLQNSGTFALKLEKNFYNFTKFEAVIPRYTTSKSVGVTAPFDDEVNLDLDNFTVDLTSRLLNKKEWNLKEITDDYPSVELITAFKDNVGLRDNKVGNIYFTQGQDEIQFSDAFGQVIKQNLILNVVREALNEYITYYGNPLFLGTEPFQTDTYHTRYYGIGSSFETDQFSALRIKFNIEYITLQDYVIPQNREDTRVINRFSELALKQSDKQINVELASRKSYGELQRAGLPNYQFTLQHNKLSTILPIGLMDSDGYVITSRVLEFHNFFIKATYHATDEHNRLQEGINVNQEYRVFEVPTSNQIYDRIEYYNDIIFIKPYGTLLATTQNLITPKFYEQLVSNLKNDKTRTKGTFALVWTDGFNEIYGEQEEPRLIISPIIVVGNKQTIQLSIGFQDNQVVGDMLETKYFNLSDHKFNKAVKYTNSVGTFENMWVAFFNDIEDISIILDKDTYDYDDYPLTPMIDTLNESQLDDMLDNSLINNGMLFGTPSTIHGDFNPFKFYKDSSENATIQYGASIQSYFYGQFIVGQRFTSFNSIVNNLLDDLYLYTYENNTKYGIFNDQLIKSIGSATKTLLSNDNVTITAYSKGTNNHGITVEIDNTLLVGKTSWAIGDNDGNLYLACNEPINKFDFEGTHLDYRITEIGKTPYASISYQETMAFTVVTSFSASIEIGDVNQDSLGSLNIITAFNAVVDKGDENTNTLEITITPTMSVVLEKGNQLTQTMAFNIVPTFIFDTYQQQQRIMSYDITPSFAYGLSSGSTSQDNLMLVIEPTFNVSFEVDSKQVLEVVINPTFLPSVEVYQIKETLSIPIEPLFVATVQNVALITETPTVGTPTCYRDGGVNYIQVNVRNNDTLSAVIKNGTTTLTTLAPNQQASLIIASGISTPYSYNISITAQASGKDVSTTVTRSGTITLCLGS